MALKDIKEIKDLLHSFEKDGGNFNKNCQKNSKAAEHESGKLKQFITDLNKIIQTMRDILELYGNQGNLALSQTEPIKGEALKAPEAPEAPTQETQA
jgi:hypothetical protein